jgi:hypothetical protein
MKIEYKNVFSQAGDDGVIESILNYFEIDSGVCCEFGACDGLLLSNTANLWKNNSENWKALLIECSDQFKSGLIDNTKDYSNVNILFDAVTEDNINNLLEDNLPEGEFHLLSIDIDGNDLGLFQVLELKPSIVIVESTTIYGNVDKFDISLGCSPLAVIRVGLEKGYVPVSSTGNIYLVHESLSSRKPIPDIDYDDLYLTNDKINQLHNLPKLGY